MLQDSPPGQAGPVVKSQRWPVELTPLPSWQMPASCGWIEQLSESVVWSVAQGQPDWHDGSETPETLTSAPATRLGPLTEALPR